MNRVVVVVVCLVAVALIATGVWLYTPDTSRASLDAKYHVEPGDYRTVAGLRLHLRDTGPTTAPVVFLLHGFGSSLETWDAWADRLSARFRVIRFDWPGFGLTGADPTGDYSDARSLDILAAVMDQLGVARASLVGNSMGGKFAWMFAAMHPERVERLVLISPDGFASQGFEYGKKPTVPAMVKVLPYVLPKALVRMSLAPAFGDPGLLTDALVERYRDFMIAPGIRRAMLARMEQVILQPPEPLLRAIRAPTLLLWGEKDGMIPFPNSADYAKLIPRVTLVSLPGVGHVPQEEAPAASLEPVTAFLAP